MELPFVGVYREVVEPERLVFTLENPANRSDPNVELATVTFQDIGGVTRMAFHQVGHLPDGQYLLLEQGYSRFFQRLADHLSSGQDPARVD